MATSDPGNIPGSEQTVHPLARRIGDVNQNELIEITIALKERPQGLSVFDSVERQSMRPPLSRSFHTEQRRGQLHGAHSAAVQAVSSFAKDNGLTVSLADPSTRTVKLRGTAAQLEQAFNIGLAEYKDPDGTTYRGHVGQVQLPPSLSSLVSTVMGLNNRPPCRPHIARIQKGAKASQIVYPPDVIARAMDFPAISPSNDPNAIPSSSIVVGIIELGGLVSDADITAYCTKFGYAKPTIVHVPVDGQLPTNDPKEANVEVALDVETALGMAQGLTIVVYDAPNSTQGVRDAIIAAMNDTTYAPKCISMSWGGAEFKDWSGADMQEINTTLANACSVGLTFGFSSGDDGSTDGVKDGKQHMDFPASSPYALCVGGTNAIIDKKTGKLDSISVWGGTAAKMAVNGGTGGGVSAVFPVPLWQSQNGIHPESANPPHKPGRGGPDLAGVSDPMTGTATLSDGILQGVGGTSASAPQVITGFAVLSALNGGKGFGLINPALYDLKGKGFTDVTTGTNGAYSAKPGFDLTTGWGFPNFSHIGKNLGIDIKRAISRIYATVTAIKSSQTVDRGLGD